MERSTSSTLETRSPLRGSTARALGLLILAAGFVVGAASTFVLYHALRSPGAEADMDAASACVETAAAFSDYPLLYAGSEILGHKLEGCRHNKTSDRFAPDGTLFHAATDSFTFYYGTCEITVEIPSCPVPVAIIVYPPCHSDIYRGVVADSTTLRGAETLIKRDGSLRLESESYKLTIYAPGLSNIERKDRALDVGEQLVAANPLADALAKDLPLTTELGPAVVCS